TASTLSEETRDPRRAAPKAVLYSVIGAFVIGGVFLLGTLVAIPNMGTAVKEAWGPAQIIEANFSTPFATIYLLVVSAAIFVCCLSILAATIRLCFGMARDNQLPGSRFLAKVSPSLHTPVWTCIAVACIAAIPFWQYSGAGIIAIAATGMIYLSYFLGNIVIMRARMRGWPRTAAPFRLGRWGMLVNIVALLYGGAMLVNFAWPRAASNPKPNQTGGLLKLGFLDGVPILWIVVIFIALVGAVYYLIVGRTKRFAPVVAPAEDDAPLAGSGAAPSHRLGDQAAPGQFGQRVPQRHPADPEPLGQVVLGRQPVAGGQRAGGDLPGQPVLDLRVHGRAGLAHDPRRLPGSGPQWIHSGSGVMRTTRPPILRTARRRQMAPPPARTSWSGRRSGSRPPPPGR
ncbi:MAG TPA: amino acid permease, partial [Streptosporangiaceae bacterium]|nr:amino acid permease [Streptosporangiaceae bacterium]